MATNLYQVGDLVRIAATFKVATVLTDPTTVTGKWKNPAGTVTTYVYLTDAQLVRDSVGTFHFDISVTAAGLHQYRFAGTGTAQGAEEGAFFVETSNFP